MTEWRPIATAKRMHRVIVYADCGGGQWFTGEAFLDRNGVWMWPDNQPVHELETLKLWTRIPRPPEAVPFPWED